MTSSSIIDVNRSPAAKSAPLLWAIYLGISWTWCIGMFLPVLMVRDYGPWAWVVFAVPNVVGAAAMGWVLARPRSSESIVSQHHTACVAFSAVTLAFHAFFLAWMAALFIPWPAAVAVVFLGSILSQVDRWRSRLDLLLAAAAMAVSVAVLARFLHRADFTLPPSAFSPGELVFLAPVCALGFALCPYLDLTFHRARQATTVTGARVAFGVGFGVVFLSMIVLTLLYVNDFLNRSDVLRTWVAVHLCVQIGFTWMAHLRAVSKPSGLEIPIWIIAGVMAIAGGALVWTSADRLLTGETVYRVFMAFYGLVFPAYVWLCMVPICGRSPGITPRSLGVLTIVILVASPMFWLGFTEYQTLWLLPGAAVILLARLLVPTRNHAPASPL